MNPKKYTVKVITFDEDKGEQQETIIHTDYAVIVHEGIDGTNALKVFGCSVTGEDAQP